MDKKINKKELTDEEFEALKKAIKIAYEKYDLLQKEYKKQTGVNYIFFKKQSCRLV